MSMFALGYLAFPRAILGCFSSDPDVIALGQKILMIVALFQMADGTQVSTTGALRGLGNTRAALIANLIGHYPIGLALGLVLCYVLHFGVLGIWAGLAAGLIGVAGGFAFGSMGHSSDHSHTESASGPVAPGGV